MLWLNNLKLNIKLSLHFLFDCLDLICHFLLVLLQLCLTLLLHFTFKLLLFFWELSVKIGAHHCFFLRNLLPDLAFHDFSHFLMRTPHSILLIYIKFLHDLLARLFLIHIRLLQTFNFVLKMCKGLQHSIKQYLLICFIHRSMTTFHWCSTRLLLLLQRINRCRWAWCLRDAKLVS